MSPISFHSVFHVVETQSTARASTGLIDIEASSVVMNLKHDVMCTPFEFQGDHRGRRMVDRISECLSCNKEQGFCGGRRYPLRLSTRSKLHAQCFMQDALRLET